MQTTKHPYELLVRWDQNGALAGAHVQYRYVIRDGAAVIGESVGGAEPLTLDTASGFPLGDLLAQTQADALTAKAAADAERDAVLAAKAEADSARTAAEEMAAGLAETLAETRQSGIESAAQAQATLNEANATIAALRVQLAAMQVPQERL
ncbi:hypothetical protein [Azospirillum argentinense]